MKQTLYGIGTMLLTFAIGLCLYALWCAVNADGATVQPVAYAEPTEAELAKIHHHHGIIFSEQDEQGNWWGVRPNGERFRIRRTW